MALNVIRFEFGGLVPFDPSDKENLKPIFSTNLLPKPEKKIT